VLVGTNNLEALSADAVAIAAASQASVAQRSLAMQAHVARLLPIQVCVNPDLYLEEARDVYFPQGCWESPEAYRVRISRMESAFEPHYTKLKELVVGAALRHPSQPPDNLTPEWQNLLANVSLNSESIDAFARRILDQAIDGGIAGILVDYPNVSGDLTLADEKTMGLRPYFVPIRADDILAWRSTVSAEKVGDQISYGVRLTHLRIRETISEPDPADEFAELRLPAVNVWDLEGDGAETRVRYRQFVLRRDSDSLERYVVETDTFLSVPLIPFVAIYGSIAETFMVCRPLLLDIARLNISHWQASADLAHTLSLTATPVFTVTGVQGAEPVRVDRALFLEDPAARAQWEGAPVDGAQATMERLDALAAAMQSLATVTLAKKANGVESAQSKLLDASQSDSLVGVIVDQLEDSINRALAIAALYREWEPIRIALSRDFTDTGLDAPTISALANVHTAGAISHQTLLEVYKHGEVFAGIDDWTVEEELQRCEEEAGEMAKRSAAMLALTTPATEPKPASPEPAVSGQLDGEAA
jgi:hypothetical protein